MSSRPALAVTFALALSACRGAEYSVGPQFGPLSVEGGMTWTDFQSPPSNPPDPGENTVEDFGVADDDAFSGGLRYDARAPVYHYMLSLQGDRKSTRLNSSHT